MDLTVEFTVIVPSASGPVVDLLRVCDRCHDPDELVVATMKIRAAEGVWGLCGPCVREMPSGYHRA